MSERGHARRWVCPEPDCRTSLRAEALNPTAAEGALVDLVREHLALHDAGEHANAWAQSSGWLAAAGHLVELWGGPHDGERVWCPPGDLPDRIGMYRTPGGVAGPVRSATALALPHVHVYRLGEATGALARAAPVRYLFDGRPR